MTPNFNKIKLSKLPILSCIDISKSFCDSKIILDNINFDLFPGEIVGLVGRSGIGKTTLLNILAGFIMPSSGHILREGKKTNLSGLDCAVIFQKEALFPWLKVWDNVAFGLRHQKKKLKTNESTRVKDLLERTGLTAFANYYPRQLSGGMQKRAELARAFAASPSIIIADEPFSNNDEMTKRDLHQLLLREWFLNQSTILITTHDIEEAVFLAQRIIILEGKPARIGKIINIPFSYPRSAKLLQNSSFQKIRSDIFQWLLKT